jgi:phosphoglycolate phosphatase-like HAD superfamily hydrolase
MKLVLFDVDGTLIRADGAGRRALSAAFAEVWGLEPGAVEAAGRQVDYRGRLDPWIHGEIARHLGIELAPRREPMIRSYLRHLGRDLEERPARALPGVPGLLRFLGRREDRALGLLTGNLPEGARLKLGSAGLDGSFAFGAYGDDAPARDELGPVALRRAEEVLGLELPPGQVTVVGDTEHDVSAARASGFRALAVATGWTEPEDLRSSDPDLLLEDLSDWQECPLL